jgi:MinD superfamily P-loop ATPase
MKELVVISGKGGTGKTSLVASFAALAASTGSGQALRPGSGQAQGAVLADCDVDAADLHLVLAPTIRRREEFRCGHEAVIRQADCIGCGACLARCRFGAVVRLPGVDEGAFGDGRTACENCADGCQRSCPVKFADLIQAMKETCGPQNEAAFVIDPTACEGCGVCVWACPVKAIDFPERLGGEWYVSDTRHGPMVHARLIPGGENSGKLVSKVREVARELAEERKSNLVVVDGPPGVGCAVIASVSGATRVLVVTEPTLPGAHDLARVLELTRHFKIPAAVCVNKWDLNAELTEQIEVAARQAGAVPVGRVRYDRAVTAAQLQGVSVVEIDAGPLADDIRRVWENLLQ